MLRKLSLDIVLAMDRQGGIGYQGKLPWPSLPSDLKHLHHITTTTRDPTKLNAVIMGWMTWKEIGEAPLPDRINLVLTSDQTKLIPDDVLRAKSLDEALEQLDSLENVEKIFALGGARVYLDAIANPRCQSAWVTQIDDVFPADVRLPQDCFHEFVEDSSTCFFENNIHFTISHFFRKNPL